MSPRKIILLSLLAFALLCAATLAYYLPRIQPRTETVSHEATQNQDMASSAENHKPDVDQMLAQSIPVHPDDAAAGPLPEVAPPKPARQGSSQPLTKTALDSRLVDYLKQPPVQFEISSTTLTPSSRKYLDELASLLQAQPHIRLIIKGHTDSQDKLGKNQILSEGRARAVLDYLVSKGVAAGRLTSAGFGGSQPVADNETAEGRAKNRRIAFEIQT